MVKKYQYFMRFVIVLVVLLATVVCGLATRASAAAVCGPAISVSAPFTKDGEGDYCYVSTSLCTYINSWNMTAVEINGTPYTNQWVSSASIPPLNGTYTIHYSSAATFGHFEMGGTPCSNAATSTITRTSTAGPSLTPTRTRTPTITITPTKTITMTPTPSTCLATATMLPYLLVSQVVGQTNATTAVVNVTLIYGVSVTVTSEAGSFTSTTASPSGVYSVTINLVPNTINHLQVQGKVYRDSCSYTTAITTVDNFGAPLTIIQGSAGPTPTATPSVSPTPSANACSPVNADIASPFSFDGLGTFCWRSTTILHFITSNNTTSLKINGVNYTNMFVSAAGFPPKIGGYWYITYVGGFPWSHFEAQ